MSHSKTQAQMVGNNQIKAKREKKGQEIHRL